MEVIGVTVPLGVGALKIELQVDFADARDVYITTSTAVKLGGTLVTTTGAARVAEIVSWLLANRPVVATYTADPRNQGRALSIDFVSGG